MRKLCTYILLVIAILAFSGCYATKANPGSSPRIVPEDAAGKYNAPVLLQETSGSTNLNENTLAHIRRNLIRIFYVWHYIDIYGKEIEGSSWGSGVLFNKQYVITCYHLGKERPLGIFKAYLLDEGRVRFENATIEKFNEAEDLLLLKLENPVKWKTVRLADEVIYGEQIYFGGYTPLPVPRIRIHRLSTYKKGIYLHPVFFGDSGGGVFNSRGELIGIIYLTYKINGTFTLIGYAVLLEKIKAFLE